MRSLFTRIVTVLVMASAAAGQDPPSAPTRPAAETRGLSLTNITGANELWFRPGVLVSSNTYYGVGPEQETASLTVIQPVYPFKLTPKWRLVTRWPLPVFRLPRVSPTRGPQSGLGNLAPEFYLSPMPSGRVVWALGGKVYLPTATDERLGVNRWGGGPAAGILIFKGPWVVGTLVNNVWAGSGQRSVNQLTLNPFLKFYLPRGWYLAYAPLITADWNAVNKRDRWTVPLGAGVGRVFRLGAQQWNARVQLFRNAARPTFAPSWQFQSQLTYVFPQAARQAIQQQ